MIIINGVPASEEDIQTFYSWLIAGKVAVKNIKVGSIYTNIITD